MTERQDKFVDIYSKTGNATQSAIEAGYSEKTAKQKGYQLKNLLRKEIMSRLKKYWQTMYLPVLNIYRSWRNRQRAIRYALVRSRIYWIEQD